LREDRSGFLTIYGKNCKKRREEGYLIFFKNEKEAVVIGDYFPSPSHFLSKGKTARFFFSTFCFHIFKKL